MEVAVPSVFIAAEEDAWNGSVGALVQVSMHQGILQTSDTEFRAQTEARGDLVLPWAIDEDRLETCIAHRL